MGSAPLKPFHRSESPMYWVGLGLIVLATALNLTAGLYSGTTQDTPLAALVGTYEDLGKVRVTLVLAGVGFALVLRALARELAVGSPHPSRHAFHQLATPAAAQPALRAAKLAPAAGGVPLVTARFLQWGNTGSGVVWYDAPANEPPAAVLNDPSDDPTDEEYDGHDHPLAAELPGEPA